MVSMILTGLYETLLMTAASSFFSYVIGIPLGVILVVSDTNGIKPMPVLNGVLGSVINLIRSVPFMILLIMVIPLTRLMVGTSIGPVAVIPPLVIAAAPIDFAASITPASTSFKEDSTILAIYKLYLRYFCLSLNLHFW